MAASWRRFPALGYHYAAIEWLHSAFDFKEEAVHRGRTDGPTRGARLGAGLISSASTARRAGWGQGAGSLASPPSLYVEINDVDATTIAKGARAEIYRDLGNEH